MYRNLIILMIFVLLTSCISTKRFDKIVTTKLVNQNSNEFNTSDIVHFTNRNLKTENLLVKSEKIKSQFIPAILYWQWNNTIQCRIDNSIPKEILIESVLNNPHLSELEYLLNGKTIEIEIDSIPTQFVYTNQGNTVILILFYTISTLEAIIPADQDLHVTYRIVDKNKVVKIGKIEIKNKNNPVKNTWSSTQKFTNTYLDQYEKNTKILADELIKMLIKDI